MDKPKREVASLHGITQDQVTFYRADAMDQWLIQEVLPVLRDYTESLPTNASGDRPEKDVDRLIAQIEEATP